MSHIKTQLLQIIAKANRIKDRIKEPDTDERNRQMNNSASGLFTRDITGFVGTLWEAGNLDVEYSIQDKRDSAGNRTRTFACNSGDPKYSVRITVMFRSNDIVTVMVSHSFTAVELQEAEEADRALALPQS